MAAPSPSESIMLHRSALALVVAMYATASGAQAQDSDGRCAWYDAQGYCACATTDSKWRLNRLSSGPPASHLQPASRRPEGRPRVPAQPGLQFGHQQRRALLEAGLPPPRRPDLIELQIKILKRVLRNTDLRSKHREKYHLALAYQELARHYRAELRRIARQLKRNCWCKH